MSLSITTLSDSADTIRDITHATHIGSPFYSEGLLAIWEQVFGWRGVVLRDGVNSLIGFRNKTPLGEIFYSLPYGWYGGLMSSAPASESSAIFDWLRSQRFIEERLVQSPDSPAIAFPRRYQRRELTTHVLDLTAPPAYSDNTTRNIRKAQSHGLTTRRLGLDDVGAFEDLRQEHVNRTGEKRRLSDTFYTALYLMTQSEDSGVTLVGVLHNNRLIAAHLYFVSQSDVFYFDGYSTASGLELHANFFLFDVMINRSRDAGRVRFNFGASPSGDTGLERFKAGWGAQPLTYYEYVHRSPLKRVVDVLRGRG
jgi:hypothetical protein